MKDVVALSEIDRWNSFDKFHKNTEMLLKSYKDVGINTEVVHIPTGTEVGDGRWVIHEAFDVMNARVEVVKPMRFNLLDYQSNPWHVAQWSAATPAKGLKLDLAIIDNIEQIERHSKGELSKKVVLTGVDLRNKGPDLRHLWERLGEKGAEAVIFDGPVPGHPDAVQWQKLAWGGTKFRSVPPIVALVLSAQQGQKLRDLHRVKGLVTLHVSVNIRRYIGVHDVVSGTIHGDDPQDEVWCLAHTSEPGAADNASGVAVSLEAARVLEGLISKGKIPRPRRSIRFLNFYECYGLLAYIENCSRLQPPSAGVNLDMVGLKPNLCNGQLYLHESIPTTAQFVNDVGIEIYRSLLNGSNPIYRLKRRGFCLTSDTVVNDPKYGFPCPWITNCWQGDGSIYKGYHSSADDARKLSTKGISVVAAGVAGYLHFLASAGNEELIQFARAETDQILSVVTKGTYKWSSDQFQFWNVQLKQSLYWLKRWMWGGDRRTLLKQIDECERKFYRGVRSVREKERGRSKGGQHLGAERIPYRIVPFIPDPDNLSRDIWKHLAVSWEAVRPWALFWADGDRSIANIAPLLECELKETIGLQKLVEYFDVLDQLGFVRLIDPSQVITEEQIVHDLKALGLQNGADVMVHSSLSKIGHVRGGAGTVVDALLKVIGPDGTLLMPSFNHRMAKVYNPYTTPTINGSIPDSMWRRSDAVRSLQGTHAVAAIGPKAESWCKDHFLVGVWAEDSPIGKLIHEGGYILSLGVSHNCTTANHVAEMSVPCGCIDPFGREDSIVMCDGGIHKTKGLAFRSEPCPIPRETLEKKLTQKKMQRHGKVGNADARLVKAKDLWNVHRRQLRNVCPSCHIRPMARQK